jgi:hypothetical protein
MRGAGHEAVVLHRECSATKFYCEVCGAGRGNLRRIDSQERSRLSSSRRFAPQDLARRVKKLRLKYKSENEKIFIWTFNENHVNRL